MSQTFGRKLYVTYDAFSGPESRHSLCFCTSLLRVGPQNTTGPLLISEKDLETLKAGILADTQRDSPNVHGIRITGWTWLADVDA